MVLLKKSPFTPLFLFLVFSLFSFVGCGDTITRTDYLETDTYISSTDSSNHAQDLSLKLLKNESEEQRVIIKLPTGKRDSNENLDAILQNPAALPLLPFILFLEILESLLNCRDTTLTPNQLLDAKLVFDIQSTGEASLTDKLNLNLLSKPWWQTANWERAHPFSSKGKWTTPGGDLDPSFTSVGSTQAGSTVTFDITPYFKALLSQYEPIHFGLMIQASTASLARSELVSTQSSSSLSRPRLVSTYQCFNVNRFQALALFGLVPPPAPFTYYLGH